MAQNDAIKKLEARMTRLEAALSEQAAASGPAATTAIPPGGYVADPAPWPGGHWIPPRWTWPFPHPIVDPGPWPTPVVDPAPWGPFGFSGFQAPRASAATLGRIGAIGDPPPLDISRFTIPQLEAALHSINAEKARLDSMETLVKQQLEQVKGTG